MRQGRQGRAQQGCQAHTAAQVVAVPSLDLVGVQFDFAGLGSGNVWKALITFLYGACVSAHSWLRAGAEPQQRLALLGVPLCPFQLSSRQHDFPVFACLPACLAQMGLSGCCCCCAVDFFDTSGTLFSMCTFIDNFIPGLWGPSCVPLAPWCSCVQLGGMALPWHCRAWLPCCACSCMQAMPLVWLSWTAACPCTSHDGSCGRLQASWARTRTSRGPSTPTALTGYPSLSVGSPHAFLGLQWLRRCRLLRSMPD